MSVERYVSSEQVIASAAIALGLEQDEYRGIFTAWAYDALRAIGLNFGNFKEASLTIAANATAIPTDMVYPDQFELRDSTDTNRKAWVFFDSQLASNITEDSEEFHRHGDYVISMQGLNFIFSTNVLRDNFNRLNMRYYALPVDTNGDMMVPEYYKEPMVAYIEYMYTKRKRHAGMRAVIPQSEIAGLKNEWLSLKLQAISQRNQVSKPEAQAAIAQWLTMIPNFSRLQRNNNNSHGNNGNN